MRKSFLSLFFIAVGMLFATCDNATYQPYENSLYIAEAYGGNQKNVVISESGTSMEFVIRTAQPYPNPLTVLISATEDALIKYNKKNNTSYKMLPIDCYELSTSEVKITANGINSNIVRITFKPQAYSLLGGTEKYVVPVSIVSVSDASLHVMDNYKTCVFICTKAE